MIESSNISKLRSGEAVSFFDNLKSILAKADLNQLQLSTIVRELLSHVNALTPLYKSERGNKITRSLAVLDQQRDNLFMAIRSLLDVHMRAHPQESLRPRAEELLENFSRYGVDLYRKSYQEETAGLKAIMETIDAQAELLEGIRQLALTDYYEALKQTNLEFDKTYLERNSAYAVIPKEKMQEERYKAEQLLNSLTQKINAYLVLSENPAPYQSLAGEINALVSTYQDSANRRASKSSPSEELNADFSEAEG
ncbi:MAG: DUF6261 family protein [Microscillaceae bacterium]|nr:DUF6261 family protein [Microscillaceae bacterium]